jgi:hypothetical protein
LHSINDKEAILVDGTVRLIADSQVEASLIEKESLAIRKFLFNSLSVEKIELDIQVEENEKKQKVILNAKDKFQRMVQSNPSLKTLVEKLDLELER